MITIQNDCYDLIEERLEGFNEEVFRARYSDILSKYDYIVGDWGYGQLRLKGFFEDSNKKSSYDNKFSAVRDYLLEYCNFGCGYFILKKLPLSAAKKETEAAAE